MKKQNLWWTTFLLMMFVNLGTVQSQTTYETLYISIRKMVPFHGDLQSNPSSWTKSRNSNFDRMYVGEVSNGLPNGLGRLTHKDKYKYVGEFKNGLQHGQGTSTTSNGLKYVGEYKDGNRNGQGTFSLPDGGKYVGAWKDDKQHGKGTLITSDGQEVKVIYIDGELVGQQFED